MADAASSGAEPLFRRSEGSPYGYIFGEIPHSADKWRGPSG